MSMPKIRIELDLNKCVGNKNCIRINPENFLDGGSKAKLKDGELSSNVLVLEKDESDIKPLINAALACPTNAISVISGGKEIVKSRVSEDKDYKEIVAKYDDMKEFVMDPKGYFLIRLDKEKKLIEVGFCKERNIVKVKIVGRKPLEIYQTIIKQGLVSRLDHAAYLGRELQKAYIALENSLEYVQDDELKLEKVKK